MLLQSMVTHRPDHAEAEVERLVPEWQALWRRIPDATPFQSPEWLLSWWSCFGNDATIGG